MQYLREPVRNLFFTGKGGVGKTSLACASALALCRPDRRVLLVSTDPASNLDDVLGVRLTVHPTAVPEVPGLWAMNVDPEQAASEYRERLVGPCRGLLPEDAVRRMEEQLSGACTVEIAAFDAFTELMASDLDAFDHLVFDTAPTGHTLRLLRLPAAWTGFIDNNTHGVSCLGPVAGLEAQYQRYSQTVGVLSDARRTSVILVSRPAASALAEAERTSVELEALGLRNQWLVVNGVFRARGDGDALAAAMEARGQAELERMPERLRRLPTDFVPLRSANVVGIAAVRALLSGGEEPGVDAAPASVEERRGPCADLASLVDDLAAMERGLIMVMGKGGVGKTTLAAAVAVEMAARGLPVHLTTTDPAAHVAETLESDVPGLRLSRIDPQAETLAYTAHVLATAGRDLDDEGRALLEEDLRSPCTEEVAVFHAFSRIVEQAQTGFVVMDTAPTGHTLLLLDAAGAYHRDVVRNGPEGMAVQSPLTRLRDPASTRILLVTLAETTPVLEARQLQADLHRAGIEPYAWIVNATLCGTDTTDPVLRARAVQEEEQIRQVQRAWSGRAVRVRWQATPPLGLEGLRKLARRDVDFPAPNAAVLTQPTSQPIRT